MKSHDFGSSPKAHRNLLPYAIVLIGALVILVGVQIVTSTLKHRQATVSSQAEFSPKAITGPPCKTVQNAAFVQSPPPDKIEPYGGVSFARRFGHVYCGFVETNDAFFRGSYPVCEFSAPDVLTIQTRKGTFYFQPGDGKAATVFVQNDTPSCVVAAPYWTG